MTRPLFRPRAPSIHHENITGNHLDPLHFSWHLFHLQCFHFLTQLGQVSLTPHSTRRVQVRWVQSPRLVSLTGTAGLRDVVQRNFGSFGNVVVEGNGFNGFPFQRQRPSELLAVFGVRFGSTLNFGGWGLWLSRPGRFCWVESENSAPKTSKK